jgi:hypothetical protein
MNAHRHTIRVALALNVGLESSALAGAAAAEEHDNAKLLAAPPKSSSLDGVLSLC